MNSTHTVRFYPVGNGDTSQIITASGKRFLFDFCNRKAGPDDKRIDLAARLDEELAAVKRDDMDVVRRAFRGGC